jgi:DNA repair exonuclease SbcCD ATPase subunit
MPFESSGRDSESFLNLQNEETGELGDKVQQVRAELESLKQKQEEIEREKTRLEELKRRQESLEQGRADMLDKLTRALVVVQRETEESQKRVEQMHTIHGSFTQHLQSIELINPRSWSPQEMPRELSKALSAVEDARAEYIKAQAKISVDSTSELAPVAASDVDYTSAEEQGFGYWLKSGFAFTLPLQIAGLVFALIIAWALVAAK